MKLLSWNVNGVRAAIGKGLKASLEATEADIICLQEVKAEQSQVPVEELPSGLSVVAWNPAEKRGYSGVALLSRNQPERVMLGLGKRKLDTEGRVITADFGDFYLVNVYTPNSQNELRRLDYRVNEWDVAFRRYVRRLAKEKPTLFCGDLNVAHEEIDLANPKSNQKNAGFTPEERESFSTLLQTGFVDTFRMFHQDGGHYSWWSYRAGARQRNIGWRIDYVCASKRMSEFISSGFILPEVHGSDHCPVGIEFERPGVSG